jgi:hypothetical protein
MPTSKSRQELRSRFVRNAIPTEADFVDLIAASLNQADDGVLKLPDQPLGLVRQKPDQPVLRFFADPGAEGSAWQLQLGDGDKPGFGLAGADGKLALFVDGATGNVGIGVGAKKPEAALHIAGNLKVEAGSIKLDSNQKVFFMDNGQIGGQDQYHQLLFRCTEDITELREWGSIWLTAGNETCNNKPQIVVSQAEVKIGARLRISENNGTAANEGFGSLLLDHEDAGGASSIVFRSKADQGSDYSFIEYKDQNPDTQGVGASLLTIGNRNDSNDHIALMPSGNVGINTTTPGFKLDVNGPVRLGGFTSEEKDEWHNIFWCLDLAKGWDEGLIKHGKSYGFFERAGFGVHMHESRSFELFSTNARPLLGVEGGTGNTSIRGNVKVNGKVDSQNARIQVTAADKIVIDTDTWTDMPQMIVTANIDGPVLVLFKAGGVQSVSEPPELTQIRGYFRLLIDGNEKGLTTLEFHNKGWELRDVSLVWMESSLAVGNHEFKVQWRRAEEGKVSACFYDALRSLIVIRL